MSSRNNNKDKHPGSLGRFFFSFTKAFAILWKIHLGLVFWVLLINILVGLIVFPSLYLEKLILDSLISNIGNPLWRDSLNVIISLLLIKAAIEFSALVLSKLDAYFNFKAVRIFSAKLENMLAQKISELDIETIEDSSFKNRFSKIQRDVSNCAWEMIVTLASFFSSLMGLASSLLLIVSVNPAVTFLIVLVSVPNFIANAKFIKEHYNLSEKISKKYKLWNWLSSYLLRPINVLELKILALPPFFLKMMEDAQEASWGKKIELEKRKTNISIATSILPSLFGFLVGVYFAAQVLLAKITLGSMQMALRAINSFQTNLSGLVNSLLKSYQNYLYISDLVWFFDLKPQVVEQEGEGHEEIRKGMPGGIEFKDVWFRYKDGEPWILKGVSFKIEANENVAIIGENGVGKSTLVKLLCRFYNPQKGQILIDGKPIQKLNREDLWRNIAVLFQDFGRYPFSVKESIGYGDISRMDDTERIKESAKAADIHSYIEKLTLGYDNPLSPDFEKGVIPSGGQWQRIGIARTLFRRSEIIILDEPTSSIDPKGEEEIFETIIKEAEKKILILISHRFSTVRRAQNIIVFKDGKIAEQGSHSQLMKQNGEYAKLFHLQAKGYQ
ncbi:MAG: ABC transporter ATP-binding protein [Candidatus Paceibacterota bacterium]|jgi:ATP-binding cassette subfamily B protein/ATP-binding cassette subfamily C protein